ncbi:hypothetical protein HYE68_001161 [Fusarium pseudograminearum]|nr:hypothetical protein HYE68_001161 [Fusarium pseudograminearum]
MVCLKEFAAVMATFSLVEAYYKHAGKEKFTCSDTCASEMRSVEGYEEDCYQFLAKVVPGSVGHLSKVPKQYEYICSGTIDFVNACYCLAPDEPDYATKKHVKDINGRYANDEYANDDSVNNELFTNERFNDERANNGRLSNVRLNNGRVNNGRVNNGSVNNDSANNENVNSESVNNESVNNEDDPTAAQDTVFIPQTVSTTITESTTTTTTEPVTTTTTEPTTTNITESATTTTTESTKSITIEATTSTTTESTTITTTESTTATTESTTTTTKSTTATVTAIIADANCPTCTATCDSPFTCRGTISYCNGGTTCICFGTTEGDTMCALSSDCLSSEQCNSSNDCPADQRCISQNCCGFNVCVAEATNEQCDPASQQNNLSAPPGRRARGNSLSY